MHDTRDQQCLQLSSTNSAHCMLLDCRSYCASQERDRHQYASMKATRRQPVLSSSAYIIQQRVQPGAGPAKRLSARHTCCGGCQSGSHLPFHWTVILYCTQCLLSFICWFSMQSSLLNTDADSLSATTNRLSTVTSLPRRCIAALNDVLGWNDHDDSQVGCHCNVVCSHGGSQ